MTLTLKEMFMPDVEKKEPMKEVSSKSHQMETEDIRRDLGIDPYNPPIAQYSSIDEIKEAYYKHYNLTQDDANEMIMHAVELGFSAGKDWAFGEAENEMIHQREDYRYMEDDY